MRASIRLTLWTLLLLAGSVSLAAATADPRAALARLGFEEEWIRGFGERWDALQARVSLPEAVMDLALRLVDPDRLPTDPGEAAVVVHETAREAEIRRRRGEPLWRIAVRLGHELRQRGGAVDRAASRASAGSPRNDRGLEDWRDAREQAKRTPGSRPPPTPSGSQGDGGSDGGGAGGAPADGGSPGVDPGGGSPAGPGGSTGESGSPPGGANGP